MEQYQTSSTSSVFSWLSAEISNGLLHSVHVKCAQQFFSSVFFCIGGEKVTPAQIQKPCSKLEEQVGQFGWQAPGACKTKQTTEGSASFLKSNSASLVGLTTCHQCHERRVEQEIPRHVSLNIYWFEVKH